MIIVPPKNVMVIPAFEGSLDVRYDDPMSEYENSEFVRQGGQILGVDIYRCETEFGKYQKMNEEPVGSLFYREDIENRYVEEEVTSNFISKGDNERKEYIFRVSKIPIVKRNSQNVCANKSEDVEVFIYNSEKDLTERADVASVRGDTGEIKFVSTGYFDPVSQQIVKPILPDFSSSLNKVRCSYYWGKKLVLSKIFGTMFYKVILVAKDKDGNLLMTDLKDSRPATHLSQEQMDFIWQRAVELNNFILEQGGERVKLLVKKWGGERCHCYDNLRGVAQNDCFECFGTSFVNGYEGPFEILIAPPEAEKSLEILGLGLREVYTYETWTSYTPLIHFLDVIVRPDGSRLSVGPVNWSYVKSVILQQNFSLALIPENDIRYRLPVSKELRRGYKETSGRESPEMDSTVITAKGQGRSVTYENIMKG